MENEPPPIVVAESAGGSSERTPLIQPVPPQPQQQQQQQPVQPRTSGSGGTLEQRRPVIAVAPVNADEQPVPMAPTAMSAVGGVPTINCRICRSLIGLEGKLGNHVVKCPTCNEATPIRAAPEGKRYVRCPCGCLLVCKQSASRISCPRDHCRRVLNLTVAVNVTDEQATLNRSNIPGNGYGTTTLPASQLVVSHLQCPTCYLSFLLQSDSSTPYARCPHCSSRAALHQSYVRRRYIVLGLLSLLFFGGAIAVLVTTWNMTFNDGMYSIIAAWSSMFVIGLCFALGTIYFCLIKVAKVMTSATSAYQPLNGSGRYSYA